MRPGQAIDYFSRTPLDGYNQATKTWDVAISRGDFLTFDRFITERTFGQKKRMFVTGQRGYGTIDNYEVVRDPSGQVYLISAENPDFDGYDGISIYANVFLLQRADFTCEVVRIDGSTNAAGMPTGRTETVVDTFYCDMERYSSRSASEVDDIMYSQFNIWLPSGAESVVDVDTELRINGELYDVKEANLMLGLLDVKAFKRG